MSPYKKDSADVPTSAHSPKKSSSSSSADKQKDTPATTTTPAAVFEKKLATPAVNIFSNDGSFAERFKQMQSEADEKRKQQEAIEKKKEFDSSFRMRGKRKKAAADQTNGGSVAKKAKEEALDEELDPSASAYLREMRKMKEKLPGGDQGSGVRPLVK